MPDPTRIKDLFADALELAPDARADFVERACSGDGALRAQVIALLDSHARAEGFLSTPTIGPSAGAAPGASEEESPGATIGRYRLIERIGEGGYGSVWRAEQEEPLRREVALKLIKLGMDTRAVVARFDAERQALARMEHPAIARVYDAGATPAGRPYFVMELVRGAPITHLCDEERLPLRERLSVFVEVCRAVQHAHQKGVVHRDIKPSNVLVERRDGRAVPKVIDFGIAKATAAFASGSTLLTGGGQVLGTPEYMAPEQADAGAVDVDTRADVYSLGVLLYELLTGTRPFDAEPLARRGVLELLRHVREVEPPRPSTRLKALGPVLSAIARRRALAPERLGRAVRGDLDWIVMRAIEKDRERRYPSAAELAADVERWLCDEPVLANPPSRGYVLAKWVRRHRLAVGAGAAVLGALVLGLVLAILGFLEAARGRDAARKSADEAIEARDAAQHSAAAAIAEQERATQQAERARRVTAFVTDMLTQASPEEQSVPDLTVRSVLDGARAQLDLEAHVDAEVEATLRATMGEAYCQIGDLAAAEELLLAAEALRRAAPQAHSLDLANLLNSLATLRAMQDRPAEAVELYLETEAIARELGDLALAYKAMENRGGQYERLGRAVELPELLHAVLAGREALLGADHEETVATRANLGSALSTLGRYAEACPLLDAAHQRFRDTLGPRKLRTRQALCALVFCKLQVGAERDVVEPLREQLAIERELYPGTHPQLLLTLDFLTEIDVRAGRHAESEAGARELLAGQLALHGESHHDVAIALLRLGTVLAATGRAGEAEEALRRALAITALLPQPPLYLLAVLNADMAGVLTALGRYDEARAHAQSAVEAGARAFGPDHPQVQTFRSAYALVLFQIGDHAGCTRVMREVLEVRERVLGPDHIDVIETHFNLAMIAKDGGRLPEALEGVIAATPRFLDVRGWPHPRSELCFRELELLGERLREAGDVEGAERAWRALLGFAEEERVASEEWRWRAQERLAVLPTRR